MRTPPIYGLFTGGLTVITLLFLAAACSTVPFQAKYEGKPEIPSLDLGRMPMKAALIIPDAANQTFASPEFSCPLLTHSSAVKVSPEPALVRSGIPVLSQLFDGLDFYASKAEVRSQYDLYIEATPPALRFAEGDCDTATHFILELTGIGTPFGIMAHFESLPDIKGVFETTVTVQDRQGNRLLPDSPFRAEGTVLWGNNLVPQLKSDASVGKNVEYLMGKLFKEVAVGLNSSSKLQQYARTVKQESAPLLARPPAAPERATGSSVPDVDIPPAAMTRASKNRHAVVIGIEQYRQKLPQADYAANDARVMAEYLTKVLGYPEENIAVLLNDKAARTDLEKYFEGWLPNRVEKGDSVFVYFSGHGAPNPKTGKAFLVPYDGDPSFVDQTGYPLDRLYDRLAKLPAKEIVVVLDSCFSGAGGRSVIAKGMRPMVLSIENPVLAGGKTAVIAASSGDQVSSTYDQYKHGLLTYYLLRGLRGEADRDQTGTVDLAELFEYLKPQVERTARREFNNEQTPQLLGSPDLLKRGVRLIDRPKP
ncbi:MAG: caspase family protein [Nitrospirota bacterium]